VTSNLRAKSVVKEEKETKVKKGRDSVASTLAKKTQATQNIKEERTVTRPLPGVQTRRSAAVEIPVDPSTTTFVSDDEGDEPSVPSVA
jgi:hypothetical protein